jgi:hypothetical protein
MSNRSLLAVLLVLAVLQVNADSTPYVRVNQTCTVNRTWWPLTFRILEHSGVHTMPIQLPVREVLGLRHVDLP